MKSIFFSAVISDTNEQPVKLIERDIEFNTAPLRIDIVRDPANADPTLASFYEVKHAVKEGAQQESNPVQHWGVDRGGTQAGSSGCHCVLASQKGE